MKTILKFIIVFAITALCIWAYTTIDAGGGIQFHDSVASWPVTENDGVTTWQQDKVRYNDTNQDGQINTRTETVSDGISDIYLIALDNDNDGFFDELLQQRVNGNRAHSSKISKPVPQTQ